MNTKEKYFNISLLRTMATIIIVVFHILLKTSPGDGRTYFPFYIGVPVFLFVSGFLYARKPITDIKQFYKNNILKILVPTIVFAALYFSAVGVYSLFTNAPFMDLVRDSTGGGEIIPSTGHLWFIPAIILCYLTLPLLHNMWDKKYSKTTNIFLIISFVLLGVGCIYIWKSVILPFVAGFVFYKKKDMLIQHKAKSSIILGILFVATSVAYPFAFAIKATEGLSFVLYKLLKEIIVGIMGITISALFLLLTDKIEFSSFAQKFLRSFDQISFPIYFIHHIFAFGAFCLLYITNIAAVNVIIYLSVSIITAYLFMLLMNVINRLIKKLKKDNNL